MGLAQEERDVRVDGGAGIVELVRTHLSYELAVTFLLISGK